MATWNPAFQAAPVQGDTPARGDDEIRNTRAAVEERAKNEHTTHTGDSTLGAATKDWLHKAGSAVAFHGTVAPTTRLSGEPLADGQLWYDTTNGVLKVSSGASWLSTYGQLPIGSVLFFAGTFTNNVTIPGWYKCDGTNGAPDLITDHRFPRASAVSGDTGGSKTIAAGNLPAHAHTIIRVTNTIFGSASGQVWSDVGVAMGVNQTGNLFSGNDYWQPYFDLIPIIRIS